MYQSNKHHIISIIMILCSIVCCIAGCSANSSSNQSITDPSVSSEVMTEPETTTETKTTIAEPTTAVPPSDINEYVRVLDYIPDIVVDLRYATADNFTGQVIYDFTDAYLRYGTVVKLKAAQEELKELGYRIKIWDAYRPFYAQEFMWKVYPDANYVANPAKGMAGHNLGGTMDITLVNLDGSDVLMPTAFDDFSTLADRNYSDVDPVAAEHAMLLESIMTAHDFKGYSGEWWDYTDNTKYTEINDFMPK
ncbi:MAG: M15 family metallopeptidase [Lachnospira sp.]|nr:M15 family metallopeptidase [Lachnospira sp.]